MNNAIIIVEGQYFSCINYIKALNKTKHAKIELYESFQKMSFRNRCILASDKGLINLTVPLKNGREQKCLITEVEIDNSELWARRHWRTICSCYRKAPFFDFYAGDVERLIFAEKKYLFDLNMSILLWVKHVLKLKTEISFTDKFVSIYIDQDVLDVRKKWLPKNFQKGDDAAEIRYEQVFREKTGFQPNLSILDLIFCEGPNAAFYI